MAYRGKCGTKVDEGVKFRPSCGNLMEAPAPRTAGTDSSGTACRRSERLPQNGT